MASGTVATQMVLIGFSEGSHHLLTVACVNCNRAVRFERTTACSRFTLHRYLNLDKRHGLRESKETRRRAVIQSRIRRLLVEKLEHRHLLNAGQLVVSEIMFNPTVSSEERAVGLKDRDFEFIEFANTSDTTFDLEGASVSDAVSVTFGGKKLDPGGRAVVVHNREAFQRRYGIGVPVLGQYSGTLGNGGDRIVLTDALGSVLSEAEYDDIWYPLTDGGGFSLVENGESTGIRNQPRYWRPSRGIEGSPGYADGDSDPRPQQLHAYILSSRHIKLSWSAPLKVDPHGRHQYRVYRDGQLIATTAGMSFVDTVPSPGRGYAFQVSIVAEEGEYYSHPAQVSVEMVGGDLSFQTKATNGTVQDDRLDELSGLVASRANEGVFWTHNDGRQDVIFALNGHGKVLGELGLNGLRSHDIEDIAIGPGPRPNVDYLYVADIGGKKPKRNEIQIFRIEEPGVLADAEGPVSFRSDAVMVSLRYPDGEEFNAETLLVDPQSGDLFIIPKRGSASPLFRAQSDAISADGILTMERLGEITFPNASGGDISPSGREILIRNEDLAALYARVDGQSVIDALSEVPVVVPVIGRPLEPNGEAIAFDAAGRDYHTISEGLHPTLHTFRRNSSAMPGDANRDFLFDQADLILALDGGKFATHEPALWSEGDWNGDGVFDTLDIVAALQTGNYLQGEYADR